MKHFEIYSDGSGNTSESDGGYGYVILLDGEKIVEGSGYLANATNNVAELAGAIHGLQGAFSLVASICKEDPMQHKYTLISDSQLVLNYAKNTWRCKAQHLLPYREQLQALYNKTNCHTRWVKGHSGDKHNERCDELAGIARKRGRRRHIMKGMCYTLIRISIVTSPAFISEARTWADTHKL